MALSFTALLLAALVAPQESGSARWGINKGVEYCSLIRRADRGDYSSLLVRKVPGAGLELWLTDTGRAPFFAPGQPISLLLQPGNVRRELPTLLRRLDDGRALIAHSPPEFLDQLAGAEAVSFSRSGKVLFEARLSGTAKAVASLRNCEQTKLREWGVDASLALSRPAVAKANLGALVSDSDYPSEALADGKGGQVTARLDIDVCGAVTGCAAVASGGHPALDQRTCKVLSERARFEPALDLKGAPAASSIIVRITWLLPAS
ncbi:MAG TPA: TonB family protein [Allosphingosinicella sp.]|jgi:TonB family protein|uniref:TonB family protein n=1 Tax=Allosphingosinicella sp. TaxID=2823234 RepID=UPI002F26F8AF